MITRALYLSAGWLAISLVAAILGGTRLRVGNLVISVGCLAGVLLLGDAWALLTFGVMHEIALLTGLAFLVGLVCVAWMRDWNALAQTAWMATLVATLLFIIYSFQVTAFTPLGAPSFMLALIFFFIEATALVMALTHAYEALDATCRLRWRRRVERLAPNSDYQPMVSLHVPAYNEPPEVVERTLRSLAALDYPNYEVLVVDNNTPEDTAWRPLEVLCRELGPRFRFMHLDRWPGFKSGALNFALAQTDSRAEIIGSIDADYQVEPNFLRELTPAFADPQMAFVQTPQNYRDYEGDVYLESTFHGYRYFFEVSMPVRNEHNAIIFAGTMGLIRKSALQEIGGWDEWCITEDAEASLRILKAGYRSLYIQQTYGSGLIPFTFEGLKKQRFRWCFGGIQILRKHWLSLLPWSHWGNYGNRLSLAQRYFYLAGSLQWFTDPLNLVFASFLVLGGIFSMIGGQVTVRPLTYTLMVLPALFLLLGIWRFVWVLRYALKLPYRVAVRSMYNFFSLGWAVTLACIQAMIQDKGVFLRTPKSKSSSKMLRALAATRWETAIGLTCLIIGFLAFILRPEARTLFLAVLLAWQSSLYLSAPAYSLLSVVEKPPRRQVERGIPMLESRAAQVVITILVLLAIGFSFMQFLPRPEGTPAYIRFLPVEIPLRRLFQLNPAPGEWSPPRTTPAPAASPTPEAMTGGIPAVCAGGCYGGWRSAIPNPSFACNTLGIYGNL